MAPARRYTSGTPDGLVDTRVRLNAPARAAVAALAGATDLTTNAVMNVAVTYVAARAAADPDWFAAVVDGHATDVAATAGAAYPRLDVTTDAIRRLAGDDPKETR